MNNAITLQELIEEIYQEIADHKLLIDELRQIGEQLIQMKLDEDLHGKQ